MPRPRRYAPTGIGEALLTRLGVTCPPQIPVPTQAQIDRAASLEEAGFGFEHQVLIGFVCSRLFGAGFSVEEVQALVADAHVGYKASGGA